MSQLRRLVEVFENERYYPLTGWSQSLLPTDRERYSNREGDWGSSTMDDYSDAVLSTGWFWEQSTWQQAKADINVDADGYSYSIDFSVFTHPTNASLDALGGVGSRRGSVVFATSDGMNQADENMLLDVRAFFFSRVSQRVTV